MLHIALAIGFLLQAHTSTSLDEVLVEVEKDRPVHVTVAVAREALGRLSEDDTEAAEVSHLAEVAKRGRLGPKLAKVLVALVQHPADTEKAGAAVRALAALDERARAKAAPRSKEWIAKLLALAEGEDEDVADAVAIVLAPSASPQVIRDLLLSWSREDGTERRSRTLLSQVERVQDPTKTFEELASLELYESLSEALNEALLALVARSPGAARSAIALAQAGAWGASAGVMRSLGAVRTREHWEQASEFVLRQTSEGGEEDIEEGTYDEALMAAALLSAADLRLAEALPTAKSLTTAKVTARIRRAAIWAFTRLAYKDAPTIDLLLQLLGDQEVALDAYQALLFKSGVKLPLRREAWAAWRHAQRLPQKPPEDAETRLERERELRFKLGAR